MPRRAKALTRARIVATALKIIDAQGADRLTIRRVAAELGCAPMALYHHVANKDALLGAVAAQLLSELRTPPKTLPAADRVRAAAGELRRVARRHPRALPVVLTRRLSGPEVAQFIDSLLEALSACRGGDQETVVGFRTILAYSLGSVFADPGGAFGIAADRRRIDSGLAADTRFPHLRTAIERTASLSADDEFAAGLEMFLDSWTSS